MTEFLTIQPSAHTDHITEDGTELTKLPYPFHCTEDGMVMRQDFWDGHPLRIVGFAKDLNKHQVDLWWREAWAEPDKAVGMYVVSQNADGSMYSHVHAVEEVTKHNEGEVD